METGVTIVVTILQIIGISYFIFRAEMSDKNPDNQ